METIKNFTLQKNTQIMLDNTSLMDIMSSKNTASLLCKKKEMVYLYNTYPLGIYFLWKGKIKTYRTNNNGKEFITEIHKAGEFFGYPALLELDKYTDSAMALEDSNMYFIPRKDFLTLLSTNTQLSLKLIQLLAEKINNKEDQLLKLAYNSVKKRVADALISFSTGSKKEKIDEDLNTFKIKRDDLASLVGAENETTIRSLNELKLEGLINIKKGAISIINQRQLETI